MHTNKLLNKAKNVALSVVSVAMIGSGLGTNLVTPVLADEDSREVTYNIVGDESFTVDPKKPTVVTDNTIDKKTESVGIGGSYSYPVVEDGYVFNGWYSEDSMGEDSEEVFATAGDTALDLYGSIVKDDGKKATLTVTITDKDTSDPLSGQDVDVFAIDAQPTDEPVFSGTTDENGELVIKDIPRGKYLVYERDTTGVYGGESYLSYESLNFVTGTDKDFAIAFENIKLKTVTIDFDLNGGTAQGGTFATATRTSDSYLLSVGIPSKPGYTFEGWFINDTDTEFDFAKTIAANWANASDNELTDFTIRAKYTENAKKTYTFKFEDVNDTDPQDLSAYTFSVETTEGESNTLVKDDQGRTLNDILNELSGLGYTRAGNETLIGAVGYDGKNQDGSKVADTTTIKVKHAYEYDAVQSTTETVTRTIKYVYEDGSEASTTVKQVASLTHYSASDATDKVTGAKTTVPASTQVSRHWGSRKSPSVDGYLADVKNVEAVDKAEDLTADTEVVVTYTKVVDPIEVEVIIQADSQTITYDGTEHTLNTYTVTSNNSDYDESEFKYNGNASVKGTDAGTYTLMFNAKDFENTNSAYKVKFVVKSGRLTINRKTVTVTAQDASKKVGESDPTLSATVEGTLNGDEVDYRVARQRGESNGTYAITVSGKKNQGNYQLQFVNGTFVIEAVKKDVDDVPTTPTEPVEEPEIKNYVGWETNSEDRDQTITFAGIKTTLIDYTESTAAAKEDMYYLTDRVDYVGLEPGTRYKLVGTLMDKETGKPLDGVEPVEKEFTVRVNDGTYSGMKFEVEKKLVDGKTIVAFEVLYKANTDEEVASHEDLEDQNQTIKFVEPTIRTKFATVEDAPASVDKENEVYVVDYVYYQNLKVGKEYTVTGTVMDKETEAQLVGTDSVTVKFTPTTTDGMVEVPFTINKSLLEDKTIVAFEELKQGNKTIVIHADINDEDQTIENPLNEKTTVRTTATAEDGTKLVEVSNKAVVVDNVELKKLTVGTEYTVVGTLHIKTPEGKDAGTYKNADGSDYKVTEVFTATAKEMNIEMKFTVDATQLKGRETVVFENLSYVDNLGVEVTVSHEDITDEDQTVKFVEKPTIKTTATSEYGGKTITPEEKAIVKDKVEFTNLEVGKEYTVLGELHLRKDGADAGKISEVFGTTFTPDTTDGWVEVTIEVDASKLVGEKVVAFETLYENGVEIAIHADINDEGQTVTVKNPEIRTTATSANGGKTVEMAENTVIKDTVSYTGLVPGKEYTLTGTLHFKDTGAATGAPVTAKFTPATSDGSTVITFTYDTRNIEGKSLVVFEKLTTLDAEGNVVDVASHEDINDEGQTVKVVKKPETPPAPPTPTPEVPSNPTPTPTPNVPTPRVQTGTGNALILFGGIAVVAAVGLVALFVLKKKKK